MDSAHAHARAHTHAVGILMIYCAILFLFIRINPTIVSRTLRESLCRGAMEWILIGSNDSFGAAVCTVIMRQADRHDFLQPLLLVLAVLHEQLSRYFQLMRGR